MHSLRITKYHVVLYNKMKITHHHILMQYRPIDHVHRYCKASIKIALYNQFLWNVLYLINPQGTLHLITYQLLQSFVGISAPSLYIMSSSSQSAVYIIICLTKIIVLQNNVFRFRKCWHNSFGECTPLTVEELW